MAEQGTSSAHQKASTSTKLPPIHKPNVKFPRSRQFSRESPDKLRELEKRFILDGVAVGKLANDETERSQPSLNMGIPQYNALHDRHCKNYFTTKSLPRSVQGMKSASVDEETEDTSSMMGNVFDKFVHNSVATQYLQERESIGAGYTRSVYGGHLSVPTTPAVVGYNGVEGYRRNTYDLRRKRSVFEEEDPFDQPSRPRRLRTQSAPATMRLMRLKSANIYRAPPGGRAVSAMPKTILERRDLATGPV